ncbi:MAG: response regulator [Spartobacteria bacterium]|nr:response regulator [Spartobacteria bacterium]
MRKTRQDTAAGFRYTILVVDDEEPVRDFLKQALGEKYRVYTASQVREAKRLLERMEEELHVVISDYSMPGDDGITFMCDLRKTHPRTQRIMLTGFTDKELMLRAINEARLFHFIVKPARKHEILEVVEKALHEYDKLKDIDVMVEDIQRLRKTQRSFIYRTRKKMRLLASLLHLPEHPAMEPLLLCCLAGLGILFMVLLFQLFVRFAL